MKMRSLSLILFFLLHGELLAVKSQSIDPTEFDRIAPEEVELSLRLKLESPRPKTQVPGRPPETIQQVQAELMVTNISKRELQLHLPVWVATLEVIADGVKIEYRGPELSAAPPQKSDFRALAPGKTQGFSSNVSGSFAIPKTAKELEVIYKFQGRSPEVKAKLKLAH